MSAVRQVLESRVGATIDRQWRLDRLIGIGGMAAVYEATHASGRRAAFKILHRELAHDDEICARFAEEKELSSRLQHPAQVEVYGLSTDDEGLPVLVMELLEGETLAALCKRVGPLPLYQALDVMATVLELLVACHMAGIVHRDLKPHNVFLTDDGRVKLLDFGIARNRRIITQRRRAVGTPAFMAPEQAQGMSDARSDIFSVGAILWTTISGCALRHGRSADEELREAAREPIRSLALVAPEAPPKVVELVDRALAYDAQKRFPNAATMHVAVLSALAELPRVDLPRRPRASENRPTQPSTPSSLRGEAVDAP